jgi:hypothetical protein
MHTICCTRLHLAFVNPNAKGRIILSYCVSGLESNGFVTWNDRVKKQAFNQFLLLLTLANHGSSGRGVTSMVLSALLYASSTRKMDT